ncbi:MAG: hypothetical protein ABII22_06570 [Candidatus Micrarchaeota archaeon]
MKKTFVLTFVVLMFLLFGCISNMAEYSAVYGDKDFFNKRSTEDEPMPCTFGPCACFVCTKTSSFFNIFTSFSSQPNQPVECKVNLDCKYDGYLDQLLKPPYELPNDEYLMNFLIGAPSSQFSQSNALCENRLDMSVKWVLGSNNPNDHYESIDSSRATCYLDIGVIPVYVLYTQPPKGEERRPLDNGDILAAEKIAKALDGTGPVIITAEAEFDSSNSNDIAIVKEQLRVMKAACPHCMIALAPRYMDTTGIDDILSDQSVIPSVDLIAFGINTDYSQTKCNPGSIFREAGEFSRYILYKHQKPSVITYMYFNTKEPTKGTPVPPAATDPLACTWADYDITNPNGENVYSTFFAIETISGFIKSGVLGAAFYSYDPYEADPFYCKETGVKNECSLGKSADSEKSFFAPCQKYKKTESQYENGDPLLKLNAGMKLLFPAAKGATCSLSHQNNLISLILASDYRNKDITQPVVSEMRPKAELSLSCDACANSDYTGKFPFNINKNGFPSLDYKKAWCASSQDESNSVTITTPLGNDPNYEEIGSMVDYYADKRDLDPYIIRANIIGESQYDKCEISFFLPLNHACNPLGVVTGEDGKPFGENSKGINDVDSDCNANINLQFTRDSKLVNNKPTMKSCAYGVMQAIEYPADVRERLKAESELPQNTPSVDPVAFLSVRRLANGDIRPLTSAEKDKIKAVLIDNGPHGEVNIYTQLDNSECLGSDAKYNPFNIDDSMCWGTLKLRLMLDSAIGLVKGKEIDYGFVDDDDPTKIDSDKVRVAEYYIALQKYGGGWKDDWLAKYKLYLKTPGVWCDPAIDPERTRNTDCKVDGGNYVFTSDDETRCYGQTDFLKFMERCVYYNLNEKGRLQPGDDKYERDSAMGKIKWYKALTVPYNENNEINTGCKHSTCPSPVLSGLYVQCKAIFDPNPPRKSCWDDEKKECNEECAARAFCATLTDPVTHQSCLQGGVCVESCIAKNQGVVGANGAQ